MSISLKIQFERVVFAGIALLALGHATAATVQYSSRAKTELGPVFKQVLEKFIASKPGPNICLPPLFGFGDNVTDVAVVNPDAEGPAMAGTGFISRIVQFKALEEAGLVSSTESTREVAGKTVRTLIYRRTGKGMAVSQGPSICYARGELAQVVKWKGPVVLGEYQAAFVYYRVKTTLIEDWAKTPGFQEAFPAVKAIVPGEEAKVRQIVIDLSSEGWDIAEYSKYVRLQ